ncbi:increased DNA methylation 1-like [Canna indica]|uniref:Increased DNA methylation 1-like n=1 Tax=Canna indica TaxID=4628 RepID=A0AAQ3KVP2_9LILI|nr:increased DNA methylation 1-like [Canna indica]
MIEPKLIVGQEIKEDNIMGMLFGQGIDTMATDEFDGSKEEQHIFMDIFNVSVSKAGNHAVALNTTNFQKVENSQSKSIASLNCENSVLNSYVSTKSSSGDTSQTACTDAREVSGSRCFLDNSFSGSLSDPYDTHMKQTKVSSIMHQNYKVVAQSSSLSVTGDEQIDVDGSQNTSSMHMQHQQQLPCFVVETCGRGIQSSYYISKTQEEIDGSDDMDSHNTLVVECKGQEVRYGCIVNETTFVTSPISQESFASGLLLINATATPVETPEEPMYMKQCVEDSSILSSGKNDIASKRALIRELPERLCSHANRLLTDAGWKIEPRVRSDRAKLASYYIAPEEKPVVTSLSQAWKACGRRLYSSSMDFEKEYSGRQWTNIDKFWSDLIETLVYIEKNIQLPRTSISLMKRWQLLDPFIAVVCIDRKIGVLREGKSLKAINSTTFILSGENISVSMDESISKITHLEKLKSSSGGCLNNNGPSAIPPDHAGVADVPRNMEKWQNDHDIQNNSQYKRKKRKISCSSGTQRESLKSLAMHIGNNFQDSRCPHHMRDKESASPNNTVNGSDSTLISTAEDSCSTHSKAFAVGDFLGQGSLTSALGTPTDEPDSCKTSFDRFICIEGNSVLSSVNDKLLVSSGQYKCKSNKKSQNEVRQQTTVISAKRRVYGKDLAEFVFCDKLDLPNHGNAANLMEVVDGRLEMQPSGTNPICKGRLLTFKVRSDLTTEEAIVEDLKSKDSSFSINQPSGSGKKIHKKSKKISEIRACKVDDTCDMKYKEALSIFDFDEKVDDLLEIPCNQENSQTPSCKSNFGCTKQGMSETGESHSMKKLQKNMVKLEAKTSRQHAKKGNLHMSLEDKSANTSIHANIDEGDIACNTNGLTLQIPSQHKSSSSLTKAHHNCTGDTNNAMVGKTTNTEVLCSVGRIPEHNVNQKVVKPKETKACKKNRWKRPRGFRINDDDLLIAAIIKNKDYVSCNDKKGPKLGVSQPKKLKKLESQKGGCKLLLRTPGKSGLSKDGKGIIRGPRTVLCWLIERGVLSLKDVLQYRNPKNNDLVKDGWITRNGILCKCCKEIFSVSAFKTHSGSKIQKPSSNLFLQSGRSYTLCQLQAWSAEYKARKSRTRDMRVEEVDQNDDTCGLCVDGGELICCDNCPSTYHQTCLTMQDLPEGSWYCHNCICKSCGDVVKATKEDSKSSMVLECSQCEHKYHDICVNNRNLTNGQVESGTWFCGRDCKEVYLGLRSRVGILNHLADGFSWTILRCNHDDQKINSTQKIAIMAECNTKLAIALSIMEECFLPMVDPRTGIDMIPHVLYNWGSNFTRLNYRGFYTVVLEKSDEVLSVAPLRVHGVTVAEMPLIATSSEHRRQGMCRRLINAIEKMLKSSKVKMLVLSAVPGLVETWTLHFGFKPIGDVERRQLKHINLMLFPGTELLIKNLEESTTEESGLKSESSLGGDQSSNPHEFRSTDMDTTVQDDENARTDSHDVTSFTASNATGQMEEHDWEQKDLSMSFNGTPNSASEPDENNANISESFCQKTEKLDVCETDNSCLAEDSAPDTLACMLVVSKSSVLPSCSDSSAICSMDNKSSTNHVSVEPIINHSEYEKANRLSQAEATHIVEDVRVLSERSVVEENGFSHSSESK